MSLDVALMAALGTEKDELYTKTGHCYIALSLGIGNSSLFIIFSFSDSSLAISALHCFTSQYLSSAHGNSHSLTVCHLKIKMLTS